jgi:hypothetical protein
MFTHRILQIGSALLLPALLAQACQTSIEPPAPELRSTFAALAPSNLFSVQSFTGRAVTVTATALVLQKALDQPVAAYRAGSIETTNALAVLEANRSVLRAPDGKAVEVLRSATALEAPAQGKQLRWNASGTRLSFSAPGKSGSITLPAELTRAETDAITAHVAHAWLSGQTDDPSFIAEASVGTVLIILVLIVVGAIVAGALLERDCCAGAAEACDLMCTGSDNTSFSCSSGGGSGSASLQGVEIDLADLCQWTCSCGGDLGTVPVFE